MDDRTAADIPVPHGADNPIGTGLLEAASWALAARVARRHPHDVRIFHGRPGGGQSDVLWLRRPTPEASGGGDIRLNRVGTIQVTWRFDDRAPAPDGEPVRYSWQEALSRRHPERAFTLELEQAAGLPAPRRTPAATESTLTWRTIACLLSVAATTELRLTVEPGVYDGYDVSPSPHYAEFPGIPHSATDARPEDPFGISGYRFWFVLHEQRPVLALEQTSATAWVAGEQARGIDLMATYVRHGRSAGLTAVTGQLAGRANLRLH